jgi:hypothetical protein
MKYIILLILSFSFRTALVAQNDLIHEFPFVNTPSYSLGIKSVGDKKAVIFVVDDYFTSFSENIKTQLIKVDYDGLVLKKVEMAIPGYFNITVFDALYTDSTYIFMATITDAISRNSYLATIKSSKELTNFMIIDKSNIDYPHFGLLFYNTIYNESSATHDLVFTIGNGFNKEKEAMYVSIDSNGLIEKLKVINIDDHLLYDHYYNQNLKRHYISSGSTVYEYDIAFNLINKTKIFVNIGNIKKFNFEQRILFASDTEIHIIGNWLNMNKLYIYKIKTNSDGTFEPLLYDETYFPEARSHLLTKHYTSDKTIVSYSTDLVETENLIPNTTFLWELGENFAKIRQYRIEGGTKKLLMITDIDDEGNMLGYGSEYDTNKSLFFILSEDNSFLVNNIDIENLLDTKIYPNPSSHIINIDGSDRFEKSVVLTSISGPIHHFIHKQGQIDISALPAGIYILALTDVVTGKIIRQKIIKIN